MKIILASSSPRRKDILSRLAIPFAVHYPDVIEPQYTPNQSPLNYCKGLSKIKAKSISLKYNNKCHFSVFVMFCCDFLNFAVSTVGKLNISSVL